VPRNSLSNIHLFEYISKLIKKQGMKLRILLSFIIISGISSACGSTSPEDEIMDRLAIQTECWNTGDIDCFMIGYWESDSLMFIGETKLIYGYAKILQRYYDKYPDEESMGNLRFNIQHIIKLSEDVYFVVGQYHLKRTIGDKQGSFTLLWRKINGNWVIVADHTS